MKYSPVFLRLRGIAFLCITIISIIWTILLCLIIFWKWDVSDTPFRAMFLLLLFANTTTAIMLPLLMVLPFRPWLDAARFLFLLIAHSGSAIIFAVISPKFQCLRNTADEEAQCTLLNIFVLIGTWVTPIFLLIYTSGLVLMMYRRRRCRFTQSIQSNAPVQQDEGVQKMRPASSLPHIHMLTPMSLVFPVPPPLNAEQEKAWQRNSLKPGPSAARQSQGHLTLV